MVLGVNLHPERSPLAVVHPRFHARLHRRGPGPRHPPRPAERLNEITRPHIFHGPVRAVAHQHRRSRRYALERGALVLVHRVVGVEVAEGDGAGAAAGARERPPPVPLAVAGVGVLPPLLRPRDECVGLVQVREVLAEQQRGVPGDVGVLHRAHERGRRLPAAGRAAVHHLERVAEQQQLPLPGVGPLGDVLVPVNRPDVLLRPPPPRPARRRRRGRRR